LLDRCNGVLSAFLAAETNASSNLTDHIIYLDKIRDSSSPPHAESVSKDILDRPSVRGIVYLTTPAYVEINTDLLAKLNNTRAFRIASFDFDRNTMACMQKGHMHYSVSSLMYVQTFMALMLLYIQVRTDKNHLSNTHT
jgi:hypothetical protein